MAKMTIPKEENKVLRIINVWSLLVFAKAHGKMQVGEFANKDTGEVFKACIFTKLDGTRTFVAFSTKLGELTPQQIAVMKDELLVVQLESGNYSLCKKGSGSWEDVNLSKSNVNQQENSSEQNGQSHDKESSNGLQTHVWDEIERQLHEFKTLNVGQRYALYYYASLIGCDEYTRWHIEKAPQTLIDFQILLEISNPIAQNIASPNSYMSVPSRERDIKTIKNSYILSHFMKVCKSLQELRNNKSTKDTYEEIINLIGISKEQFEEIPNRNNERMGMENSHVGNEIDLGLSVLWANMNIGASSENDYGLLYGYGDTSGKMTSENEDDYPQHDIVNTEFDIAKANWGNGWRMPTSEELEELANQCKWEKKSIAGVWGAEVTGPNGNSIFLPLSGVRMGEELYRVGQIGMYWSGTTTNLDSHVELIYFGEDASLNGGAIAANGHSVRAVKNKIAEKDNECLRSIQIEKTIIKNKERGKNTWSDEFGAIYSNDKNVLLKVPYNLKEYSIRKGTTSILSTAFYGCTDIESIVIPSSIVEIDNEIFSGCTALRQIIIPNNVISIGYGAFSKCTSLSSIAFPNSIEHIGSGAFWGCIGLTAIHIPVNVKEIGEDVLCECKSLTSIVVDEKNNYYDSRNKCNAIIETKTNTLIAGCATTIIPKGVTKIAHQAFGGSELKTVVLPDGLFEIEQAAFCACAELETIIIPESVAIIGALAFCGCDSLTSIKLPSSVENIEESAFWQCKHLSTIIIPHGSKEKFERLLPGYRDLLVEQSVDNEDLNGSFTDEHGVKYSSDMKILKRIPKEMSDYSIIDGTKTIGDASFSNCESLVSVTIPRSVNDIGHYAFAGCKKIFSIIIPCGVKSIGDGAFMNCETLKSLRLSEGLVSISDDAFDGCNNLNTIFVPVEEKNRFEAMLSKFDVNIAEYNNDNVSALDEILSGLLDESGVLYSKDGKTVFTHTKKLSSYTIKTGTEIINAKAFSPIDGVDKDNISLKEIILPNSITTIWDSAFAYNEGLQEISLPSSIKTIGRDVFKGCKSLRSIRISHGTRTKFERLLPEWKDKLVEKYKIVSDTLSNFELPDGSIYNGGCLRNPFGSVVLEGIGSLTYPNGDKYKGNFKNGRPYGWGIYWFQNGHKYKGYFDEHPKGIGYLNEDYDMAVGNFYEGRLHGWAICYRNRIFKFGYWKNGKLLKDETNKTLWVRCEISKLRTQYNGNLIQISQGHEFIRFGIPERTINMGTNNPNTPKWPAIGFEFFKDGTVKVGEIRNNSSGGYILCKINGTMELGHWKDNVKDADKTLTDFQEPIDLYEVDGLDVWHCYR